MAVVPGQRALEPTVHAGQELGRIVVAVGVEMLFQQGVDDERQKGPGHAVTRAVEHGHHDAVTAALDPVAVAAHAVAGLPEQKMLAQGSPHVLGRGQHRALDQPGVFDGLQNLALGRLQLGQGVLEPGLAVAQPLDHPEDITLEAHEVVLAALLLGQVEVRRAAPPLDLVHVGVDAPRLAQHEHLLHGPVQGIEKNHEGSDVQRHGVLQVRSPGMM